MKEGGIPASDSNDLVLYVSMVQSFIGPCVRDANAQLAILALSPRVFILKGEIEQAVTENKKRPIE